MIDNLRNRFMALTMRERILLSLAAFITALTILVYLITIPALNAIDAQKDEYRAALERRASIEQKVAQANGSSGDRGKVMPAEKLRGIIDISAGEAGFTLERAEARQSGVVDVAITGVQATSVMQWMAELRTRGISVRNVELATSANGAVSFTATFTGIE